MEKHYKSVFFHHELFMDVTQGTNRKLMYEVSLNRHSFMKRAQSCEGLPYGPHQKKQRSKAIFSPSVHRPQYTDFNEAAVYMSSRSALFPLRNFVVVSLLAHLLFPELVGMWL